MTEDQILDRTLETLDKRGVGEAYRYLTSYYETLAPEEQPGAQVYNFLYCLSAMSGRKQEALAWVHEALIDRGYWYRHEVFEDEDLAALRGDVNFEKYVRLSDERYQKVLETSRTLCTWSSKEAEKIALVLHGNQQNYFHGRTYWDRLASSGYQIEYVQSAIPDSAGLYRWEDDSELQLWSILSAIPWDSYERRILCGFSAGCNEILRTLLSRQELGQGSRSATHTNPKICEEIILVAPWIPVIGERQSALLDVIAGQKTSIRIVCGREDVDCVPLVEAFSQAVGGMEIDCQVIWIEGMGHSYPAEMMGI